MGSRKKSKQKSARVYVYFSNNNRKEQILNALKRKVLTPDEQNRVNKYRRQKGHSFIIRRAIDFVLKN